MNKIPLVGGGFAIVDKEDYDELSKYKWHLYRARKTNYARRTVYEKYGRRQIRMHRQILGKLVDGYQVDHINGNGLDNRKENLRKCTNAQNAKNRSKTAANKSGFKGVHWHKKSGKWLAQIGFNGTSIHLGVFDCKVSAARAYDEASKKYHGEFAKLNFPNQTI